MFKTCDNSKNDCLTLKYNYLDLERVGFNFLNSNANKRFSNVLVKLIPYYIHVDTTLILPALLILKIFSLYDFFLRAAWAIHGLLGQLKEPKGQIVEGILPS